VNIVGKCHWLPGMLGPGRVQKNPGFLGFIGFWGFFGQAGKNR